MPDHTNNIHKITTQHLIKMKSKGEKISMITAYDYSMAFIVDKTEIDIVLVGDSASNVMAGNNTTLPITLDQMIWYAQSVRKAVHRALLCVDMPFGSYQISSKKAVYSAIRIMKETGADSIKMEGGKEIQKSIKKILSAGIPIMGHLGLTPQSINQFGNYAVQATKKNEAKKLIEDACLLEKLGCFSIVLEKIPAKLGKKIAKKLSIPIIGIGAGPYVDGQVLVLQDMLGMNKSFSPRFLRRYIDLYSVIKKSVDHYVQDVKNIDFPNEQESYW